MITRLYVDNYRCLVNFELRLAGRQLLLGANGSGKSSVLDVLWSLWRFVVEEIPVEQAFPRASLTRWVSRPLQTLELDVRGDGGAYRYSVVVEHDEDKTKTSVRSESLAFDGKPLYASTAGEAQLFRDDHSPGPQLRVDWRRSGLGLLHRSKDSKKLTSFRDRLARVVVCRPNPSAIAAVAGDDAVEGPGLHLEHLATWYRGLVQHQPDVVEGARDTLRQVLPGFHQLRFGPEPRRELRTEWNCEPTPQTTARYELRLDELSDGQKCLVALYLLLERLRREGGTLLVDEPDNFLALPEIQPWLDAATDSLGADRQVIATSHHPELIDAWALSFGLVLGRDAGGPARVAPFTLPPDLGLAPAEAVARGWAEGSGAPHDEKR